MKPRRDRAPDMTVKPKAPAKPRSVVMVEHGLDENPDAAVARIATRPEVQAAATIQKMQGDNHEVNALARELSAQVAAVNGGDLRRVEGMLTAQAHTLDELFNNLARRAQANMAEFLNAAETYFRLAFKAQSQCRATLETLVLIKNPPVFAKQANIAHGPQQVNNDTRPQPEASRAGETKNLPNKLSEANDELHPDTRTSTLASRADSQMETVGEINRAEVAGG
jgi:hypothetical protein